MLLKLGDDADCSDSIIRFMKISYPEFSFQYQDNEIIINPAPSEEQYKVMASVLKTVVFSERLKSNPVLVDHTPNYSLNTHDVLKKLEASKQVRWLDDGLAMFEGDFLRVKRGIERLWANVAYQEYSAHEIENPGLWSVDLFAKTGYLSDFPQEALFVFGVKGSSKSLSALEEAFSTYVSGSDTENISVITDHLKLRAGCQPSVCTSCYFAVSSNDELKNKIYTTANRVFRNEGGRDLMRLTSFTVRDIMAVGERDFVLMQRDQFINTCTRFIKVLGLRFKIEVANDPFYTKKLKKISFQNSGALKYEITALIPSSKSWLAVGSINFHMTSFGDAFGIKMSSGETANSCCVGIGFERLVFALFSQFGIDLLSWPREVLMLLDIPYEK